MAIVKPLVDFLSLEMRKRYSTPCGLGEQILAFSLLGDDNIMAGVYQKRPRKTGQIFVRMRYILPNDPRSPLQIARRNNMKNAVIAWQALTLPEKNVYNKMKSPIRMTGFNRYIRLYLKGEI